jgi:ribonuclease E
MPNKMLIDASHPEETRVVVVRGSRIEEFDFESQDKKQLRGNIYLARVTRVEPSLQAAFVEYGGNRHGFLAFSEIHPDYYQIPVADRQALLRAEAAHARAEDEDEEEEERGGRRRRRGRDRDRGDEAPKAAAERSEEAGGADESETGSIVEFDEDVETVETLGEATGSYEEAEPSNGSDNEGSAEEPEDDASGGGGKPMLSAIEGDVVSQPLSEAAGDDEDRGIIEEVAPATADDSDVESVGAEDALDEARARRKPVRRQYKIQEVIKRRQILLVQVVKEERGNKGAALTTYMSLAGRYSVLMPNTARGGGISRKITNAQDRKRLKDVVKDLDVPEGMGVILRTAGENRTKAEIKRDYEYLMRLWENVRNLTLQSTAPALVYEEGSLIKRSVRDLYNKDIDEILVSGDEGYREAKDFMRMLMPSHAKMVQPYRDTTPIFVRSGIEAQLDRMLQPQVTLKSGGYIIINQTEALVAIDVNSGRSTKEHSIEDTALHTNLEAAEEVARQLRLRDLAGLIVIDFIDMEENRNNRAVEKRLKDHLKNDRARIQVGRISHFGLMEMSRQRIRASVLESTMKPCPHCGGTGHVRSDSSVALLVVRAVEEFLLKDSRCHIIVKTPFATAFYVLNHKRGTLVELERRFRVTITLETDETLGAQHYNILRGAVAEKPADFVEPASLPPPVYEEPEPIDEPDLDAEDGTEDELEETPRGEPARVSSSPDGEGDHQRDRKRRRRRRRRGGRDRDDEHRPQGERSEQHRDGQPEVRGEAVAETGLDAEASVTADTNEGEPNADLSEGDRKKRRRGRRGGKRNRRDDEGHGEVGQADEAALAGDQPEFGNADAEATAAVESGDGISAAFTPDAPVELVEAPIGDLAETKPKRASRARKPAVAEGSADDATVSDDKPARKPRASRKKVVAEEMLVSLDGASGNLPEETAAVPEPSTAAPTPVEPAPQPEAEADKPKKGGWWQRSKGFF